MFNLPNKKNKNQETIEDELFGRLSFVEATEYEPSYLFFEKEFRPLNSIVEYQVFTDIRIISEEQRKWALEIEDTYDNIKDKIEKFINDELGKMGGKSKEYSLEEDLELNLITIPRQFQSQVEWSLDFKVKKDFAFFTVEFKDWEPYWLSTSA